jgi:hypothetical protein
VTGEHSHGVRCGPDPDPAVFAFGMAPPHITFPIGLIGGLTDTGRCGLESLARQISGLELFIHGATLLRIQMPGFAHHGFSDALVQLSADQPAVGVGQLNHKARAVLSRRCATAGEIRQAKPIC